MVVVVAASRVELLDLAVGAAPAKSWPFALVEGGKIQLVEAEDGMGAWDLVGLHHLQEAVEQWG